MKKTLSILSLFALVLGTLGGCVVEDDVADDDGPDTTVVNPPAPDTDVNVTPPSGGSVEIDR